MYDVFTFILYRVKYITPSGAGQAATAGELSRRSTGCFRWAPQAGTAYIAAVARAWWALLGPEVLGLWGTVKHLLQLFLVNT